MKTNLLLLFAFIQILSTPFDHQRFAERFKASNTKTEFYEVRFQKMHSIIATISDYIFYYGNKLTPEKKSEFNDLLYYFFVLFLELNGNDNNYQSDICNLEGFNPNSNDFVRRFIERYGTDRNKQYSEIMKNFPDVWDKNEFLKYGMAAPADLTIAMNGVSPEAFRNAFFSKESISTSID